MQDEIKKRILLLLSIFAVIFLMLSIRFKVTETTIRVNDVTESHIYNVPDIENGYTITKTANYKFSIFN